MRNEYNCTVGTPDSSTDDIRGNINTEVSLQHIHYSLNTYLNYLSVIFYYKCIQCILIITLKQLQKSKFITKH